MEAMCGIMFSISHPPHPQKGTNKSGKDLPLIGRTSGRDLEFLYWISFELGNGLDLDIVTIIIDFP